MVQAIIHRFDARLAMDTNSIHGNPYRSISVHIVAIFIRPENIYSRKTNFFWDKLESACLFVRLSVSVSICV